LTRGLSLFILFPPMEEIVVVCFHRLSFSLYSIRFPPGQTPVDCRLLDAISFEGINEHPFLCGCPFQSLDFSSLHSNRITQQQQQHKFIYKYMRFRWLVVFHIFK
jgi:hypothetical protein